MFAKIVYRHSPAWYRTPRAQTAALGCVFFFVFSAYTTIQFYSATIYGAQLAADSVSAVYLSFTLCSPLSAGVVNKWGCPTTMFLGVLGYAGLVLASLIYFLYGGETILWSCRLVVLGGLILGCAAALLWTAQGRLILQFASKAEDLGDANNKGDNKSQTGKLMGLFWAIFQCSSLVGGAISFLYYDRTPEGSAPLYVLFLGFILAGAVSTQFLLHPSMLSIPNGIGQGHHDVELTSESTPLAHDASVECDCPRKDGVKMNEDLSHQSWREEVHGSLSIFYTRKMAPLLLLFFYSGFNQPYQQSSFGNRFVTKRTIGLELIVFHLWEIIAAIVCGRFLDREGKGRLQFASRRSRAISCLTLFSLINATGNLLAWAQEKAALQNGGEATAHDISDWGVIAPSISFAAWGFADAQIQIYCYWIMGTLYKSGQEHSRAVGAYKCVQSAGTALGFYLTPTSRLSYTAQLACSSVVFVAGTLLSLMQLPP